MSPIATVCADIGSAAKGNFGWWSSAGSSGDRPSGLATHVAGLLNDGTPVALGFECPLFVPLVASEMQLTSARPGEGSRAWSAGAGCGALATGLVQVVWVLEQVRLSLRMPALAHLAWPTFVAANSGLFLWEAFVSGSAKFSTHPRDAQAGAEAFLASLPDPTLANAVACDSPVYSLVGAALLRSGWSEDTSLLHKACLVLRARPNVV
jgi:hypothetical protein